MSRNEGFSPVFAGLSIGAITVWVLGVLLAVDTKIVLVLALAPVLAGCAWGLWRMWQVPAAWRKVRRSARNEGLAQILAGASVSALTLVLLRFLGTPPNHPVRLLGLVFVFAGCAWAYLRELRLAHRVDRAGDRLCLHCRYDLSDLDGSGVCPECGAAFDAAELSEAWNILVPPARRALARRIFRR